MNRELAIIALIVFVTSLFTRSVDPVVPLIADGLLVEVGTAALLSTAFALPYAARISLQVWPAAQSDEETTAQITALVP